jgi:hypothetical protein
VSVETERLLELSRRADWTFPTSSGPPLRPGELEPWAEELLAARGDLAPAATALDRADAAELGANAWRIWMVTRELDNGRAFLAAALDGSGGTPRHRALALYGDGLLAFWTGAYDDSRQANETALALAGEAADDQALTARTPRSLAQLLRNRRLRAGPRTRTGSAGACRTAEPGHVPGAPPRRRPVDAVHGRP